jgi:inorganic pyrophosphatase
MALLSEALTQTLIPAAALIGIGFALFQWFLVSRVRVSNDEYGYNDSLIENEEEGVDDFDAVIKCSEIQSAISVGELSLPLFL